MQYNIKVTSNEGNKDIIIFVIEKYLSPGRLYYSIQFLFKTTQKNKGHRRPKSLLRDCEIFDCCNIFLS